MRLLKEIQNLLGNYQLKSGMYHYYRNEYAQAVEFLRKALKDEENLSVSETRNVRYYLTLSLLESAAKFQEKGELEEGLEQLTRAIEISPTYPDVHFRLGRMLEQLGRVDDALDAYREAARHQPDYLETRVALAFCLLRNGRRDEAATAFGDALDVRKEKLQRPFDRGIDALRRGEIEEASDQFHQCFLALPELAQDSVRKALDWLKSEEHEKALAELDHALARNPKFPDIHNFRGVVLHELDRLEEALDAFRLSSALSPRYLVPRLNLAFTLVKLGEYKEAEGELESILELEPGEPASTAKLEDLRSGRLPEKRRGTPRGAPR